MRKTTLEMKSLQARRRNSDDLLGCPMIQEHSLLEHFGSVRPRLTRKACSPKTRLFDCAERSNKRVEISLLQRQIDDSVQMCKQAFF